MFENQQEKKLDDIRKILQELLKVVKIVSMYPEDNPLPQSVKQSMAERLVDLTEEYGEIKLRVEADHLVMDGELVYQDSSRENRLAGVFFEAGIKDLAFRGNADYDDILQLLDVMKMHINRSDQDHDLVTLLWEADLASISFTMVEDVHLSAYDGPSDRQAPTALDDPQAAQAATPLTSEVQPYDEIFLSSLGDEDSTSDDLTMSGQAGIFGDVASESAELRTAEAASAMGYDDLPASEALPDDLLRDVDTDAPSEDDRNAVQALLDADADFDTYGSTVVLLKEILLQEVELDGFSQTVAICEKVLSELIEAGELASAGRLLRLLSKLEGKIQTERPRWAECLKEARMAAGSGKRLAVLGETLNAHEQISTGQLRTFLDQFDWQALNAITDLLGVCEHRHHRESLCDYLTSKGRSNPEILSKGIYDKRWYVVRNTVMILANLGDDKSIDYLRDAINHRERRVRLEIASSLKYSRNPRAADLLVRLATDQDPEIRGAAVDSLVACRGSRAYEAIAGIVKGTAFATMEPADQEALLYAYSVLGQERALSHLVLLIRRLNLFRDRSLTHLRRVAFGAMVRNPSPKTEPLLKKLAFSIRPSIRLQAIQALRSRREQKWGGEA